MWSGFGGVVVEYGWLRVAQTDGLCLSGSRQMKETSQTVFPLSDRKTQSQHYSFPCLPHSFAHHMPRYSDDWVRPSLLQNPRIKPQRATGLVVSFLRQQRSVKPLEASTVSRASIISGAISSDGESDGQR